MIYTEEKINSLIRFWFSYEIRKGYVSVFSLWKVQYPNNLERVLSSAALTILNIAFLTVYGRLAMLITAQQYTKFVV